MRKIVLASASPRRKRLLEQLGLEFEVDPSLFQETVEPGVSPQKLACSIAAAKAEAVAARHPDAIIIAADSFIDLDGHILGKPHTPEEARRMLGDLSGRSHIAVTGLALVDTATGRTYSRYMETRVDMKRLTSEEIDAYVKTGEPLDKAGAYAIQGRGAGLIEKIEGDYNNVVGLPLSALAWALKEFGIESLGERFDKAGSVFTGDVTGREGRL
jgi:septum formation protein